MNQDPQAYFEALGQLPELSGHRLKAIREVFDHWLSLQHQIKGLDRYHLHESPEAMTLDFQQQVHTALKAIDSVEKTIKDLESAYLIYEKTSETEKALKTKVKNMVRPPASSLISGSGAGK